MKRYVEITNECFIASGLENAGKGCFAAFMNFMSRYNNNHEFNNVACEQRKARSRLSALCTPP